LKAASFYLVGHRSLEFPVSMLEPAAPRDHLAIVFPGAGYTCDKPLLYYATSLFLDLGISILLVEQNYSKNADWLAASSDERNAWCESDSDAVFSLVRSWDRFRRYTLLGKSFGTNAVLHLLQSCSELAKAQAIWLTPSIALNWTKAKVATQRSLWIVGSSDPHYQRDKEHFNRVRGQTLVIEGADHSMEVEGSVERSIDIQKQIIEATRVWLANHA
jgi:hypothetical protein